MHQLKPTALSAKLLGQDWVKEHFPPKAKASMDQLVAALEKALAADIETLPWMSDDTKKAAEAKLALYRNKIGYPGEMARLFCVGRQTR